MAVVAAARKLAVIGWHLLSKREPYRYAQPAVTERKLQKLRVRATGQERKSGPKPGGQAGPKLAAGVKSRTVPALAEVLAAEGLPQPAAPTPGEIRTIEQSGCADYVASLTQPKMTARRPAEPKPVE